MEGTISNVDNNIKDQDSIPNVNNDRSVSKKF